jgi:cellulose synthase/poly-beta-1,6-N-acetylglucosamine synthase-like glycosyltransferase
MNASLLVFLLSAGFIFYVLIGYPLILLLAARRSNRLVRKDWRPRSVSLILPVHNGEMWIESKLQSICALDYPRALLEIIIASDGCSDRTETLVENWGDSRIRLLRLPRSGKAGAINAAIAVAGGEILFFTDVRQLLEPASLHNLVECFSDPSVGVVSGELVLAQGRKQDEESSGLYWRYEKWIRMRLSRIDSVLGATGCIYAMRRELAVPMPEDTLLDDVYLPLAAFFRGYRVILDGSAKAFDQPMPLKTEFRRKIRTQAGVYQIIGAYPALLGPKNRMWIHFVSHKLGRLLLPWALILNLAASFGLPPGWRAAAIGAHLGLYTLALLDIWVPERSFLKRISSPARTFIVLLLAALFAVSICFLPGRRFWKVTSLPEG